MKSLGLTVSIAGLLLVVGCGNKVQFSSKSSETVFTEAPVIEPAQPEDPPIIPNPDIPKPLSFKNGTCPVGGENVLSCLNCASTDPVLPPPLLSKKAQELWDIMTVACSIHNESDPSNYVAPSREQILRRLIQCSPTAYPDSNFTGTQGWTINQLLTNPSAQRRAFSKLYYNSYSTDFETYFGLDIGEARYTFCRGQASFNTGGVYPKEYYDSLYGGVPYTLPPTYVRAQRYRQSLRSCLAESLRNPNPPQQPTIPGQVCEYQTAEGEMSQLVIDQINKWMSEGHTVYFEGFNQCGVVENPEHHLDSNGPIKLAIKTCR